MNEKDNDFRRKALLETTPDFIQVYMGEAWKLNTNGIKTVEDFKHALQYIVEDLAQLPQDAEIGDVGTNQNEIYFILKEGIPQ